MASRSSPGGCSSTGGWAGCSVRPGPGWRRCWPQEPDFTHSITLWHDSTESVVPGLTESAELFRRVKDGPGEGMVLIFLGLAGLAEKPPDPESAARNLHSSLSVLRRAGDRWGETMALVTLGRVALMRRA